MPRYFAAALSTVTLGATLWVGARPVGPLPPLGGVLDPVHGAWAAATRADLPPDARATIAGLDSTVEVRYDARGVPHIFAPDERALGRAFGWAQMQAHANLILELYGQARGRAAEYWGASHEELDVWIRRMGLVANARDWYAAQEPGFRRYLDAFAEGMNAWANAHRADIPDSLEVVLPVSAADVLAHGQRVLITSFVTSPERVQAAARAWSTDGSRRDGAGDEPRPVAVPPARGAKGHEHEADARERRPQPRAGLVDAGHRIGGGGQPVVQNRFLKAFLLVEVRGDPVAARHHLARGFSVKRFVGIGDGRTAEPGEKRQRAQQQEDDRAPHEIAAV